VEEYTISITVGAPAIHPVKLLAAAFGFPPEGELVKVLEATH